MKWNGIEESLLFRKRFLPPRRSLKCGDIFRKSVYVVWIVNQNWLWVILAKIGVRLLNRCVCWPKVIAWIKVLSQRWTIFERKNEIGTGRACEARPGVWGAFPKISVWLSIECVCWSKVIGRCEVTCQRWMIFERKIEIGTGRTCEARPEVCRFQSDDGSVAQPVERRPLKP